MSGYQLCLPSVAVAQAFHGAVRPMFDGIITNIHESRTLAALWDALLLKIWGYAFNL